MEAHWSKILCGGGTPSRSPQPLSLSTQTSPMASPVAKSHRSVFLKARLVSVQMDFAVTVDQSILAGLTISLMVTVIFATSLDAHQLCISKKHQQVLLSSMRKITMPKFKFVAQSLQWWV